MMKKKKNKYQYLKVLQGDFGYGWDDIIAADSNNPDEIRLFRDNIRIYRREDPRPYRVISRRIPADEVFHI